MALVLLDRVRETSTTTGTGTISLLGAVDGYQAFSAIGDGNTTYYTIFDQLAGEWEVGIGTYTSSGATLSRDTVLSSSNGGALVTFGAGSKDVFVTYPAEKAIYEEANGDTIINAGPITVLGPGTGNPTPFTSTLGRFYGNDNTFQQIYIQNQNDGSEASADIVAYNDLGDGATNFIDIGINSSNYSSPTYPVFTPGSGYVYNEGGELIIGTSTADDIVMFVGGVDTTDEALRISNADKSVAIVGDVSVGGTLDVTGAATFSSTVELSANPTTALEAATKAYVDQQVTAGLHIHEPVRVETTGNLNAVYTQGGTLFNITTITSGTTVTTSVNHGLSEGDQIWLYTSAGNGLDTNTAYFVFSAPALNQLTLSLTFSGPQITGLTNATGLTYATRANSGVGAFLTNAGTKAALTIDGIPLSVTNRVMVRLQTNGEENGVYEVTTVGSPDPGGTNWVLTRTADASIVSPSDPNGLGTGDYFFTQEGLLNAGDSHVLTTEPNTMIIGYTPLTYTQFSGAVDYVGGTNIDISGQTISLTGTVAATNGGTGTSTVATGDLLYGSGTNTWSKLPVGFAYRSLVVNGAGTQVEWNGVSLNQVGAVSGSLPATNGGTGFSSYAQGDMIYANSSTTLDVISPNTSTTKKFLNQTGTGSLGQAPIWSTIAAADVSGLAPSATTDTTDAANITSGTLPSGRLIGGYGQITGVGNLTTGTWSADVILPTYGGTGQSTYSNGQLLIGNALGSLTKSTLTAGTGITITNGNGSIQIASSGTVPPATSTTLGTVYGNTGDGTTTFYTSLGYGSSATGSNAVALGTNSAAGSTGGVSVGWGASSGQFAIAMSRFSNASGLYGISIGYQSGARQTNAVALGANALANGTAAVAIGASANASFANTIVVSGTNAGLTAPNAGVFMDSFRDESAGSPDKVLKYSTTTKELFYGAGSSGSVTNVSVASANGFSGTVATSTTTPNITLQTTVTGLLQGDGAALSAVTIGSGLSFTGGTLSVSGGGVSAATNVTLGTVYGDTPSLNLITQLGYQSSNAGTATNATIIGASAIANSSKSVVIGSSASLSGTSAGGIVIGDNASIINASSTNATVVGQNAQATGFNSVVIGQGAQAGAFSTAIGRGAGSTTAEAVSIGSAAAAGAESVSIGNSATTINQSVAVGLYSQVVGDSGVAIGYQASAGATSGGFLNTVIGSNATSGNVSYQTVVIGSSASNSATGVGNGNTIVGASANVTGAGSLQSTVLGYGASASSGSATALGASSVSAGGNGVALGAYANVTGSQGTALGANSIATNNSVAVGQGAKAQEAKSIALGYYAVAPAALTAPAIVLTTTGSLATPFTAPNEGVFIDTIRDESAGSPDKTLKYNSTTKEIFYGAGSSGAGTVTDVSVVTANGFAGTVATSTTTPAITLTTGVTGLLKGNGTAMSAAVSGTDYQAPILFTTTGTSGASTFVSNTLNIPQYQGQITLTTTGTSGAATLIGTTLNIPQYAGATPAATATTLGTVYGATPANTLTQIGYNSVMGATINGTAIGSSSNALDTEATAIGTAAKAPGYSVAVGWNANAGGISNYVNTVVGANATVTSANLGVLIGADAQLKASNGVAIGWNTTIATGAAGATAVGYNSQITAGYSTAIGYQSQSAINGASLGAGAKANYNGSIAIGANANAPSTLAGPAIILSAQTTTFTAPNTGVFVTSIRDESAGSPDKTLKYNSTTKEIFYGVAAGASAATPTVGGTVFGNVTGASTYAAGIGYGVYVGTNSAALGAGSGAFQESVSIGANSYANFQATSVGYGALASASYSTAIGTNSKARSASGNSVVIGTGADTNYSSTIILTGSGGIVAPNSGVFVDSIRDATLGSPTYTLKYDDTTKEIFYGTGGGGGSPATPSVAGIVYGSTDLASTNTLLGYSSSVGGSNIQTVVLGQLASASGDDTVVIGYGAYASAADSIAVGVNAGAGGGNTVAIGKNIASTGDNKIIIGKDITSSITTGGGTIAILAYEPLPVTLPNDGLFIDSIRDATLGSPSYYLQYDQTTKEIFYGAGGGGGGSPATPTIAGVVYGATDDFASGDQRTILGFDTTCASGENVAIGYGADVYSASGTAVGAYAQAFTAGGVALGYTAQSTGTGSIALGTWAVTQSEKAIAIGSYVTTPYGITDPTIVIVAGGTNAVPFDAPNNGVFMDSFRDAASANATQQILYNTTTKELGYDPIGVSFTPQTISANISVPTGYNGYLVGPITVANGFSITVANGANFVVVQ